MWDDIIAGTIKLIKNYGGHYAAIFIIAAVFFPVVTITAGTGYAIGWDIVHFLLFIFCTVVSYALFGGPYIPSIKTPSHVRKVLLPISCLTTLVMGLSVLHATKPVAVIAGLLLSQAGLFYLIFVGSGIALMYGLAVAAATKEEVKDAEKREVQISRHLIAIAAWECVAAWYIISLGQYLSLYAAAFVICAAGIVLYGGIAWELFGDFGKKALYYTAVAGCLGATIHAIYRLLLGENLIDATWATWNFQDFLKKAVDVSGHTMEWFVAIMVVLAIGFIVSRISGKKAIHDNVRLATFVTTGIFFLVWLVWFKGYGDLSDWLMNLGQHALPTQEVWHGIIRLLVAIILIPALAIRLHQGGFRGFTIRLLWITPCVLLPWFLFEVFLWKWYPYLILKLDVVIDTFLRNNI